MKKIFAIYFDRDIDESGQLYPNEKDKQFNEAYFGFCDLLIKKGVEPVVITRQNKYVGNGEFYGYWRKTDDHRYERVDELVKPTLIFDKGHIDFSDGLLNFFNGHDFARLGRNKYSQSVIMEDAVPRTQLVCSKKDYDAVLRKIDTEKIVVKPLNENGGIGMTLCERDRLCDNKAFPVIMQEFVETSGGVDGVVDGRHDIRLFVLNGEVVMSAVRQPAEGNWLSNTHQGGTIRFCRSSEIDNELLEFAKPIVRKFDELGGKLYSVDFMHGNGRWYMVEMNDRPGMPAQYQDKNGEIEYFYDRLTDAIAKEIA